MNKYKKELTIGLSVLIACLVLFFGINYLKGINIFKDSNYYYATYTNVTGLTQSAPVTLNGFKVGLVKDIVYEYENPGHVKVELSLDKHLKVTKGTKAVIVSDLLGTASVDLQMAPGSDFCAVGDQIEGTTASGMMESIGNDLMPAITSILPKVDSLLATINALASDPALAASIRRMDAITANLETSTALLSRTMAPLPAITSSARNTFDNVGNITLHLDSLTASLNEMPLDQTVENVRSLTARLDAVVKALDSNDSSLGLLLHNPELYNNLNSTVASLDSLFVDIKRNPKRYISIKLL